MRALRGAGTVMALAATLASQAAWAENAIYEGDCARAQVVKDENTIDKLMSYSRYKGVAVGRFGSADEAACQTETVMMRALTLVSRSTTEAVFSYKRTDLDFGTVSGTCRSVKIRNDTTSGTVRFSTRLQTVNGRCEVYVWSEWTETDSNDSNWRGAFSTRVIMLSGGSFTVAQGAPAGSGKFFSPIGYTGVL